jgi:hypothetical protein
LLFIAKPFGKNEDRRISEELPFPEGRPSAPGRGIGLTQEAEQGALCALSPVPWPGHRPTAGNKWRPWVQGDLSGLLSQSRTTDCPRITGTYVL